MGRGIDQGSVDHSDDRGNSLVTTLSLSLTSSASALNRRFAV